MSSIGKPTFVPGLELSRRFYWEIVRPILDAHVPGLRHAAALIGSGSETLGFDDEQSTDHHWGLRLQIFLGENDYAQRAETISTILSERLPYEYLEYSTNFSAPDPDDNNTQLQTRIECGPVNHMVTTLTVAGYVERYLGFDIRHLPEAADWLSFPMQKLRTFTGGEVYHDDIGLQTIRDRFAFYPHDVWIYLMAAGWARIGQEEHLMGRAGSVGDEIGSALIASRLVRDIMRLCFLMERQYAPYAKWFGTAFGQLRCAHEMMPALVEALSATRWQDREKGLSNAYEALARMHNALGITKPMPEHTVQFHGRPYQVMAMQGFADSLLVTIADPEMRLIAEKPPIGGIDFFSDNTDLLENVELRRRIRRLYE